MGDTGHWVRVMYDQKHYQKHRGYGISYGVVITIPIDMQ